MIPGIEAELEAVLAESLTAPSAMGTSVTLIAPDGTAYPDLGGRYNDISQVLDPESGQFINTRQVAVSLRLSDLHAAGAEIPEGEHSRSAKPWRVVARGETFKVRESSPDRVLGWVTLGLEVYQ